MGRPVLHGISSLVFSRCVEIPEHSDITDDMLKGVMPEGKSLSMEIKTSDRYITAGTRCYVCVKLTGENGVSTTWHCLGNKSIFAFFAHTFERGSVTEHKLHHDENYTGYPVMLTMSHNTYPRLYQSPYKESK